MALDEIPEVYKTDEVTSPQTTAKQNIFTPPSLPSFKDEHEGIVKSITAAAITATVTGFTIGSLICIWKKYRYNSSLM